MTVSEKDIVYSVMPLSQIEPIIAVFVINVY